MNLRRGLFRIWLVMSVIWVAIIGVYVFAWVMDPYVSNTVYAFQTGSTEPGKFSKYSEEARVFLAEAEKVDGRMEAINLGTTGAILYTGRNKSEDDKRKLAEIAHKAHQQAIYEARFLLLRDGGGLALLPPTVLLIIGSALFWAFSGFARQR
jgi:hypothetical protein